MAKVMIHYTTGRKVETEVENYNPITIRDEIREISASDMVIGQVYIANKQHVVSIEPSEVQ